MPVEKNIRYADTYLVEVVDKSLSDYQIKEGTRFIGSHAFQECSLSSIYIPNSVMNIGSQAFWESNNLTTIICSATTPPVCEDLAFDNFDLSQMELLVPASSINTNPSILTSPLVLRVMPLIARSMTSTSTILLILRHIL